MLEPYAEILILQRTIIYGLTRDLCKSAAKVCFPLGYLPHRLHPAIGKTLPMGDFKRWRQGADDDYAENEICVEGPFGAG